MRRIPLISLLGPLFALALAVRPATGAPSALALHAEAGPDQAPIATRLHYRGWIVLPRAQHVNWITPRAGGNLTWGAVRPSRIAGAAGMDTAVVEGDVQVFALGSADLPGIRFVLPDVGKAEHALPVVHLTVTPTPGAADSNANFRPVRGPLAAPWWERVPWRWVAAGALLLAMLIAFLVWRRRRRPTSAAAPSRGTPEDPVAESLAELAALRRLGLPAQQRYSEHAFQLTLILRRFLERTTGGLVPGLTSGELVGWLSRNPTRIDVARLDALLRVWDHIKFARAPGSLEQAADAEAAVEAWIRAQVRPVEREVA